MKISVVIPVLNEAAVVADAIARAWSSGVDEVIVSDGGSRDDTIAVAQSQRCQIVEGAAGRAVQQNRGAAVATGDVLLFLHADNWLEAGAAGQISAAMEDPRVHAGAFRQHIESASTIYRWIERGNALRVRLLGVAYGDQAIFIRREAFLEVGGFPEVALMEDLRLMRALRRMGRPVLLQGPVHVSPRRWQQYGVLRQTLRNWMLVSAERFGVSPECLARFYPPP